MKNKKVDFKPKVKSEPASKAAPKGLQFKGVSFNEFHVASMNEAEWLKHGKEKFKESAFFGTRNDQQQEELLKEVYKAASEMTGTTKEASISMPAPKDPKPDKRA